FGIDHFIAIGVNDLTLHVHHVIEIERTFSDEVIALLHTLLRSLDRFIKPPMFEFLALLKTEALPDFRHSIARAEIAHQIVFETNIEPRFARVALTPTG